MLAKFGCTGDRNWVQYATNYNQAKLVIPFYEHSKWWLYITWEIILPFIMVELNTVREDIRADKSRLVLHIHFWSNLDHIPKKKRNLLRHSMSLNLTSWHSSLSLLVTSCHSSLQHIVIIVIHSHSSLPMVTHSHLYCYTRYCHLLPLIVTYFHSFPLIIVTYTVTHCLDTHCSLFPLIIVTHHCRSLHSSLSLIARQHCHLLSLLLVLLPNHLLHIVTEFKY